MIGCFWKFFLACTLCTMSIQVYAAEDQTCIDCHGGKRSPVVHSYTTSKHGVIMQLEQDSYDWQQPLTSANYRVPGCSYCHMQQDGHNVNTASIASICKDCHAPRYIKALFANGEDMQEIARKKFREAYTLVTQAAEIFTYKQLEPARKIILAMKQHLTNVKLGVGHQSPDYQWWHGQPALDGDLLRIKGYIGDLYRKKKLGVDLD